MDYRFYELIEFAKNAIAIGMSYEEYKKDFLDEYRLDPSNDNVRKDIHDAWEYAGGTLLD